MMTHDDFNTVIHAKTTGTWNLHRAAQEEHNGRLDFFTMLSSISGVVGNKGQANYASANTFLDAFAHYRRSLNLRANTVDLGAIEDVGYIAEQHGDGLRTRIDRDEWTPINEKMLRHIINYSIFQQDDHQPLSHSSSAQLITGLSYPLPESSDLAGDRRFGYLLNNVGEGDGGPIDGTAGTRADQDIKAFRAMVASGHDTSALIQAALELLQIRVTRLLQLDTEVEPSRPLMTYGLDSLSAVELRGWVRQQLGAELSTLDITNASSLTALSEKLVMKLQASSKP
jgi:aryl carrier-like protein